jgi:hypothetical protein
MDYILLGGIIELQLLSNVGITFVKFKKFSFLTQEQAISNVLI